MYVDVCKEGDTMEEYIGNLTSLDKKYKILFSFSYRGKNYAVLNKKDGLFCTQLKYNPFSCGVYVNRDCKRAGEKMLPLAYEIYDMLNENNIRLSGEHVAVEGAEGNFTYTVKTQLRFFNWEHKLLNFLFLDFVGMADIMLTVYFLYCCATIDWNVLVTGYLAVSEVPVVLTIITNLLFLFMLFCFRKNRTDWQSALLCAETCAAAVISAVGIIKRPVFIIPALVLAAAVVCLLYFSRVNAKRKSPKKRVDIKTVSFAVRCVLIPMGIIVIVFGYFKPSYRNMNPSRFKAAKIEAAFEESVAYLAEEKWREADIAVKQTVLQSIADYEALVNKTYSAEVVFSPDDRNFLSVFTKGLFDNDLNIIVINEGSIEDSNNAVDAVITVLHEYEHARQHYIIENDPESEEAKRFKENFDDYTSGLSDYSEYHSQISEVDARDYATKRMLSYYSEYCDYRDSSFYTRYIKGTEENVTATEKKDEEYIYTLCHPNSRQADDVSEDFIILKTYIGKSAAVKFPAKIDGIPVTRISGDIFDSIANIDDITDIFIPATVTDIGDAAFLGCEYATITVDAGNADYYMLDSVMLMRTDDKWVMWVDAKAEGTVNIPADSGYISVCALTRTPYVTAINVEEGHKYYKTVDGMLYRHDNSLLICPGGKKGVITLPDFTTKIKEKAFYECHKVTGVVIPASCTEIQSYAFAYSGIKELNVPPEVTNIASSAFSCMPDLETLHLSPANKVKYESLDILSGKNQLLLSSCPELSDIYFDGTLDEWDDASVKVISSKLNEQAVTVHCTDGETQADFEYTG